MDGRFNVSRQPNNHTVPEHECLAVSTLFLLPANCIECTLRAKQLLRGIHAQLMLVLPIATVMIDCTLAKEQLMLREHTTTTLPTCSIEEAFKAECKKHLEQHMQQNVSQDLAHYKICVYLISMSCCFGAAIGITRHQPLSILGKLHIHDITCPSTVVQECLILPT